MDTKVKSWLNILLFLFLVVVLSFLIICNIENRERLLVLSSLLIASMSIRYLLFYENIRLYKFGYTGIIVDAVVVFFMCLFDKHGIAEIYFLALSAEVLVFYPAVFSVTLVAAAYCAYMAAAFFLIRFTTINDFALYSIKSLITVIFITIVMSIVKYLVNENTLLKKALSSLEAGTNSKGAAAAISEVPMRKSLTSGAFTLRELDIARLMANGFINKEIAAALFLTEGTVKNYISSIYEKLGTSDRVKAVELLKAVLIK